MSNITDNLKKDFAQKLNEAKDLLVIAERAVVKDEFSEGLKSSALNSFEAFDAAIIRFENFCDYVPVKGSEQVEEVLPEGSFEVHVANAEPFHVKKSLDLDAE